MLSRSLLWLRRNGRPAFLLLEPGCFFDGSYGFPITKQQRSGLCRIRRPAYRDGCGRGNWRNDE
jgi:hypothetical protein